MLVQCPMFLLLLIILLILLLIFNRGDKLVRGPSKKSEHRAYIKWHVYLIAIISLHCCLV